MSCFVQPGMEYYKQDVSDVCCRYIGSDTILEHSDQRMYGVSIYEAVLEFTCVYTSDKYCHHPIDSHDNCKCDCVGNDFNITAVASFRRKLDDIMAVWSNIHGKWTIHGQTNNTRFE